MEHAAVRQFELKTRIQIYLANICDKVKIFIILDN